MVETGYLMLREKRDLIGRVAGSELFRRAPKLREFLLYVADCTLENRVEDVRAQAIAEKVFHRSLDQYDGGDTIVRAEARNLRKRLEKYFETEGAGEPWVVIMPKGGYSLAFQQRDEGISTDAVESMNGTLAPMPIAPVPGPQASAVYQSVRFVPKSRILATLCVCLSAATVVATMLAVRWYPMSAGAFSDGCLETSILPFSSLFDNRRDTLIVTSDTAFLKISEIEGRRFSLNEYLIRAYPDIPHLDPPALIRDLNWSEFTDAAETRTAGLIMRRNASCLQRTALRSGRQVQLGDFKTQNIILLGSPISNPWADLYANQSNFRFNLDGRTIRLLNRSPLPGEQAFYPTARDDEANLKYAHIMFLPNSSPGSGSALLLAGTTAEATAAAGEFLLDDAGLAHTLRRIGVDPKGPPRFWELVLRATTFIGGATHTELIGYRLHPYAAE